MVKFCVHKLINGDKLHQHVGQRVDQYQPNMLVQFGMGENVGEKVICQTRSITPKNIFVQGSQTDTALIKILSNFPTWWLCQKQACQTVQTSGTKIFASNISQNVGKVCPLLNSTKKYLLSIKIFTFYEINFKYDKIKDVLISERNFKCWSIKLLAILK